ncbi:MAG: hypothetical protein ACI8WW_001569 [Oceanospirillaceae bacterium]
MNGKDKNLINLTLSRINFQNKNTMKYFSNASSTAKSNASVQIKESSIAFGITPETAATLPNPAELFLGSFSACILKNVERFSEIL